MAEARNLEEFVYGPDGDNERNLQSCIAGVLEQAKARGEDEVRRIRATLTLKPTGMGATSSTAWSKVLTTETPPETAAHALMQALYEDPGEGFSGQVRLMFSVDGHSSDKLGSYSRILRPGLYPAAVDENGVASPTGSGQLRAHFDDAVRPALEMSLKAFDRGVALMDAAARIVEASHPPPPTAVEQSQGVAADLLKGFVGVATAAGENDRMRHGGQIAQTILQAPQVTTSHGHRPPAPIAFPERHRPPSPRRLPGSFDRPLLEDRSAAATNGASGSSNGGGAPLSEAQVRAWAQQNPGAARKMVTDFLSGGGS